MTAMYIYYTRHYEAPMVWSFNTLRHLTVMCIDETKPVRTYDYSITAYFFFLQGIQYGVFSREFIFTLCTG